MLDQVSICPICDNGIYIDKIGECLTRKDKRLIINFECPICAGIIYQEWNEINSEGYYLKNMYPHRNTTSKFSEDILNVSEKFVTIYNESEIAENNDLLEVCGPGYRKSLEFLIKDYIIQRYPSKKDEIEKKFLGKCINENIENEKVKETAKRATWLGNDETHYIRKWESKDLKDMKGFIKQIIFWIESELLYEKMKQEMP